MVELSRMDSWCRLDVFDHGSADGVHVYDDPPRLHSFYMEYFYRLPSLHMVLLLHRALHEPLPAIHW